MIFAGHELDDLVEEAEDGRPQTILMQIAIAEMMTLPNVPINVTINEYVEIAKLYSTHKSGGYINGMLDAIARNLVNTGRLMKHMDPVKEHSKKSNEETPKVKMRPRIKK